MLKLNKKYKVVIISILVLFIGILAFYLYNYKKNKPNLIIKGTIVNFYEKDEILGMAGEPYYNKMKYFCLKTEEIIRGVPKIQPVCFKTLGFLDEHSFSDARKYNVGETDVFNLKWYAYDIYDQHYEYYAPLIPDAKN